MVAVGGGGHGSVVVGDVLAHDEGRAVGEDDVVCCEAFFNRGWRGDDDNVAGAEPEGKNGAVLLGEEL